MQTILCARVFACVCAYVRTYVCLDMCVCVCVSTVLMVLINTEFLCARFQDSFITVRDLVT